MDCQAITGILAAAAIAAMFAVGMIDAEAIKLPPPRTDGGQSLLRAAQAQAFDSRIF
jgi:hypothetical protein